MIKKLRDIKSVSSRRKFLESIKHIPFEAISVYPKELDLASLHNCENMVGATSVPLGIAGPLEIHGSYASGEYFIPLATTEGALVASVSRGCKAITENGGVTVVVQRVGITRGPVFYTGSLEKSERFSQWLKEHEKELAVEAEKTSSHLKLMTIKISFLAHYVFVQFFYDTMDAMGMNMATIATQRIAQYIEEKTGVSCLSVAGNFDVDKKPAYLNFLNNRGFAVWAEVELAERTLKTVLKTNKQKIFDTWLAKCVYGSMMSGSLGFNAHFANMLSALFIACGQDVAHVVEGSMGVTTTQINKKGLTVSIYVPSLVIGTVGGATSLPTQKEALTLLGVSGGNEGRNALAFAEIVGGVLLAGEISLLAALSQGVLASSHQRFARGE